MTRYVAVTRGFRYPVGAHAALAIGRVSQMTDAERDRVEWKTVQVGDDCSDMPAGSLAHYLARGDVAIVADALPSETAPAAPSGRVVPMRAKKGHV